MYITKICFFAVIKDIFIVKIYSFFGTDLIKMMTKYLRQVIKVLCFDILALDFKRNSSFCSKNGQGGKRKNNNSI
jgi:hypothetical protein